MTTIAGQASRLTSNAFFLMLATAATSIFGLVYWSVAARVYPVDQVGIGNGLVAAGSLLAGLAQLSLGMVFLRFLPTAGARAGWLVSRAFALAALVAAVLALVYVLSGLGSALVSTGWAAVLFLVAVPVLTVFALQDMALIGLDSARVVAGENLAHSLLKLALLPAFAGISVVSGVFLSWVVTTLAAVAVIVTAIFRRIIPRSAHCDQGAAPFPERSALLREMLIQHANTAVGYIISFGVPLLVLWRLGPTQAAHLALPWLIGSTFLLLDMNILAALRIHASSGQSVTAREAKRVALLLALISFVGALIGYLASPLVLSIAAPTYGSAPTEVLRWMCVAAPLWAVWHLLSTFLWIENRMSQVIAVQAAYGLLTLSLIWVLSPSMGITAVGVAWFAAGASCAALGLVPLLRRIRAACAASTSGSVTVGDHPVDLHMAGH